jgi:hypothetical protein
MARRRKQTQRHHGGGYQTSQQFFDPDVYPPSASGIFSAPSSAPTATMIRPVLPATFQAGGNSRRKQRGGGVQTSQQFFDPAVYPPSAGFMGTPSSAPTANAVRPVLLSTFPTGQSGGTRRRFRSRSRSKMSGGFSPSVMGGFVSNAQAVAVPLVLYLAYHTMVPKKGKGSKTRRASRK